MSAIDALRDAYRPLRERIKTSAPELVPELDALLAAIAGCVTASEQSVATCETISEEMISAADEAVWSAQNSAQEAQASACFADDVSGRSVRFRAARR